MTDKLRKLITGKKLMILGFGREGQSTYQLIRSVEPNMSITIADKENKHQEAILAASTDKNIILKMGQHYLDKINNYDLIFKSPGIKLAAIKPNRNQVISSQTQLFLEAYSGQTIGITGTKGKSTTASLIYHALSKAGKKTVLVGNIGIPPFSALPMIKQDTIIVFELSAHQLQELTYSPKISVLLNIYEEHLDHFQSFDEYAESKSRIFNQAKNNPILIYNLDQPELNHIIPKAIQNSGFGFSLKNDTNAKCYIEDDLIYCRTGQSFSPVINIKEIDNLIGQHNLSNIMAALLACTQVGLSKEAFKDGLMSFQSLAHRLEFVGTFKGIHFYNDSISTIPEATIAAVKSLPETDTLILGGFDRGIHYDNLIRFLNSSEINNFIFIGPAGKRMKKIMEEYPPSKKSIFMAQSFDEVFEQLISVTQKGKICLLSPAAASYDSFKDFTERGERYKKMARNL